MTYFRRLTRSRLSRPKKLSAAALHRLKIRDVKIQALEEKVKKFEDAEKKTELNDAVRTGTGKINSIDVVVCCMDFKFIFK